MAIGKRSKLNREVLTAEKEARRAATPVASSMSGESPKQRDATAVKLMGRYQVLAPMLAPKHVSKADLEAAVLSVVR